MFRRRHDAIIKRKIIIIRLREDLLEVFSQSQNNYLSLDNGVMMMLIFTCLCFHSEKNLTLKSKSTLYWKTDALTLMYRKLNPILWACKLILSTTCSLFLFLESNEKQLHKAEFFSFCLSREQKKSFIVCLSCFLESVQEQVQPCQSELQQQAT